MNASLLISQPEQEELKLVSLPAVERVHWKSRNLMSCFVQLPNTLSIAGRAEHPLAASYSALPLKAASPLR
ncbi:hypothetical protein [Variovorax soli]|uniref:Uncharacterized protein n=1 Tax=Variovorax soli TaxID=376815 RepID=A0ABU1NKM5_9BURK|nr:hypothetical protein [Variovorax soli]MDR6539012.1 hypothetical protein [Variovorax soli]